MLLQVAKRRCYSQTVCALTVRYVRNLSSETEANVAFIHELTASSQEADIRPEFNFDFLCDPRNTDSIKENIANRKGIGNIDRVVSVTISIKLKIIRARN